MMMTGKSTVAQRIVQQLRDRILAGEFPAGSPLREEELAATYNASRHVIREVLRILASEGMADYTSFRGARVPSLTHDEIDDIFQARRFLECGMLLQEGKLVDPRSLAEIHRHFSEAVEGREWQRAFRLDVEFHSKFVALGRSPRLLKCHHDLMQSLNLAHLIAPEFLGSGLADSVPQHAEIIVALIAADIPRAVAALEHHLEYAKCLLLQGTPAHQRDTRRSTVLGTA